MFQEQRVHHASIGQKHVGQEPPVTVLLFPIEFQPNRISFYPAAVEPEGFPGQDFAPAVLVIDLGRVDPQVAYLAAIGKKDRVSVIDLAYEGAVPGARGWRCQKQSQ